jgi:DNA-binding Lrp family transcriptional regulator
MSEYSANPRVPGAKPKNLRGAERGAELDEIDRALLTALAADARTPNTELAAKAGIAPSTSLGRVKSLQERGIIRGFHADIDPAAVGLGLQAMISIRLQAQARRDMPGFTERLSTMPEVQSIFFLAGEQDFVIHVAVADSGQLRALVSDKLSVLPEVADTMTNLIFEHVVPRPNAPRV